MENNIDFTVKLYDLFDTSHWTDENIKNYYSQPVWNQVAEKLNMPLENVRGHIKMYLRMR